MFKIDFINFTPISALIGGLIIGSAVVLFYVSTGRLAGISGILNSTIEKKENRFSNILFIIGLVLGPLTYIILLEKEIIFSITSSVPLIIIAGFFVGIGTKISRGCTSGHGICGISRFSVRSIFATITFMICAIITVFIFQLFGVS